MSNKIMPSGLHGYYHKQDMLELIGNCCTPQPSKIPISCTCAEVIQNEDDKKPCDVVFTIDTDFFRYTFSGCILSHITAKTHTHAITTHFYVSKHAQSHCPKDNSNAKGKVKE